MSRRLSVGSPLFFPQRLVLLALLAAALLPGLPVLAQEGATHAGCDALACIEHEGEDCPVSWVSLPVGQPEIPIVTAEDLAAAIPHAIRVTKKFPKDEGYCESYSWDPVTGTCTAEPPGCPVPEPYANTCGSSCFCINPGEGFEVERSSGGPWQLFGTDGPVEWTLQPNSFYIVSVPFGVKGLRAHHLLRAFEECTVEHVSRLNCDGTVLEFYPGSGPDADFPLVPGEAYGIQTADVDCMAHGALSPRPTYVRHGCDTHGSSFFVSGTGLGEGYGWAVDTDYTLPYPGLEEAEAEDPFAPGAGPGADAAAEAAALVEDINAQDSELVAAQVDRGYREGDRICVLGRPMHPVLWVSPAGTSPQDGCDVNDRGPCDLEGASIELHPFPAPVVWLDREFVHWTDVADVYDVVWGHIQPLRETDGDYSVATGGCLEDDTREHETSHEWLEPDPDERDAIWILVRAANAWIDGYYDQGAEAGLVGARDPGIAASGADCP